MTYSPLNIFDQKHLNSWGFLVFSGVLLLLTGCTASTSPTQPLATEPSQENSPAAVPSGETITLTISAAASLQDALEKIDDQFQAANPSTQLVYNFGASGALQQQIEQGAPVDVFFSAAAKQMDALQEKDLIQPESRRDVVANALVLIAAQNSTLQITDLTALKDAPIEHLAVGEFRSVPAGQYAQQAFEKLALLESLQPKFIFSNNVRAVLAAVSSGNADVGMVYATDARLADPVQVLMTVPEDLHDPIRYPIAILKNSPHPEAAQAFLDFLAEDTVQQTFTELGFVPVMIANWPY